MDRAGQLFRRQNYVRSLNSEIAENHISTILSIMGENFHHSFHKMAISPY